MQITTSRKDVAWNYGGTIVAMGSNFVLLPFLVAFLNEETLGLWYVFMAVGNLIMLFEFGFNPTFARNFAFVWAGARSLIKEGRTTEVVDEVDAALLARVIAACKMVYQRISILALIVLAIPGTVYVLFISQSLPVFDVAISWSIFAVAVLVNLYFLYYSAMLRGIGSIAAENKIKIVSRVAQLVCTVVFLVLGLGLMGVALGFAINALLYRILVSRAFWKDERISSLQLKRFTITKEDKQGIYRTISYNAYRDGGVQVSNYASTQASTIICSLMLGLAEAGTFSIALQFATAIGNLALALSTSYRPMIQAAYQRDDIALVQRSTGKSAVVYIAIFLVGFVCVLATAYPLLNIFKPDASFDPLVFCAVSLYMLLFDWHTLFASMLSNMNQVPYVKAYIFTAICGIVLSVVLIGVGKLGVWGLVLGLALPQIIYNNWKWPYVAARAMNSTVRDLLKIGLRIFRKQDT